MSAPPAEVWAFSLVLPPDWVDVPLDGRRRAAVNQILRRTREVAQGQEVSELRHALRRALDATSERAAAEPGARSLHLCVGAVGGPLVPASLLLAWHREPEQRWRAWASALKTTDTECVRLRIDGRPALRVERVAECTGLSVQYLLAAPDGSVLSLSFAAPVDGLTVPHARLFAAIAGTTRWTLTATTTARRARRPAARPERPATGAAPEPRVRATV